MRHPDANEIVHEQYGWHGKCFYDDNERFYDDNERFYDDNEPNKGQDIIDWLKSENAYLRGKIEVYEKFLKDRGYIKEEE